MAAFEFELRSDCIINHSAAALCIGDCTVIKSCVSEQCSGYI